MAAPFSSTKRQWYIHAMRFERTICKQVDYSKEIALFALAKYMLVWVAANNKDEPRGFNIIIGF